MQRYYIIHIKLTFESIDISFNPFSAIKCPSRPGITNGIVDCTNGDMYKSVCSSSCLVGFKKSGVSTSTCERLGSVGAWSDPLPQCLGE